MSDADENEIKFVLRDPTALEVILDDHGIRWQHIRQGYLNENTRVRRITEREEALYYLTYKQRLPNHHNLEIEGSIEAKVFEQAWPYTLEKLIKRRFKIEQWDIDFYRWKRPYFALAEVEMPPETEAYTVLPIIQPYIHFIVPREDGRFAARRLADEAHVEAVARDLGLI